MARKPKQQSGLLANAFDRIAAASRAGAGSLPMIATFASIGIAAVALAIGVPRLRSYIGERSFVEAGSIRLAFLDPPPWLDNERTATLRTIVANAVGDGSVLDPARLVTAQDALAQSGWFREIRQVRLSPDGGFIVDAVFRQPVATVLYGSREYMIDDEGCRVPLDWELGERPSAPHWIALHHAASPPPGAPGAHWSGADIDAGLALLEELRGRRWEQQVAAIDLAEFTGAGLVVRTVNNGLVLWGYPPGVTTTAEPPTEAKLRNLDHLFASTGYIDNGSGRMIDLRTDVPSIRPVSETAQADTGRDIVR
jgi:hypothetical protein